jgi:hypothetical protein
MERERERGLRRDVHLGTGALMIEMERLRTRFLKTPQIR